MPSRASPHHQEGSDDLSADPFFEETHTLNHTESQENATRLMDDLELLQVERMASNEERDEKGRPRSKSNARRHAPEPLPEDAFHTLTNPAPIPIVKPDVKPTLFFKAFKELRRFPRVLRYIVYVCIILYPST